MPNDASGDRIHITILEQEQCHFCREAYALLDQLCTEYPLDIVRESLDSPAGQQLAIRHGILFAPGILIDGEFFSYGRVSERKLRRDLWRRQSLSERR